MAEAPPEAKTKTKKRKRTTEEKELSRALAEHDLALRQRELKSKEDVLRFLAQEATRIVVDDEQGPTLFRREGTKRLAIDKGQITKRRKKQAEHELKEQIKSRSMVDLPPDDWFDGPEHRVQLWEVHFLHPHPHVKYPEIVGTNIPFPEPPAEVKDQREYIADKAGEWMQSALLRLRLATDSELKTAPFNNIWDTVVPESLRSEAKYQHDLRVLQKQRSKEAAKRFDEACTRDTSVPALELDEDGVPVPLELDPSLLAEASRLASECLEAVNLGILSKATPAAEAKRTASALDAIGELDEEQASATGAGSDSLKAVRHTVQEYDIMVKALMRVAVSARYRRYHAMVVHYKSKLEGMISTWPQLRTWLFQYQHDLLVESTLAPGHLDVLQEADQLSSAIAFLETYEVSDAIAVSELETPEHRFLNVSTLKLLGKVGQADAKVERYGKVLQQVALEIFYNRAPLAVPQQTSPYSDMGRPYYVRRVPDSGTFTAADIKQKLCFDISWKANRWVSNSSLSEVLIGIDSGLTGSVFTGIIPSAQKYAYRSPLSIGNFEGKTPAEKKEFQELYNSPAWYFVRQQSRVGAGIMHSKVALSPDYNRQLAHEHNGRIAMTRARSLNKLAMVAFRCSMCGQVSWVWDLSLSSDTETFPQLDVAAPLCGWTVCQNLGEDGIDLANQRLGDTSHRLLVLGTWHELRETAVFHGSVDPDTDPITRVAAMDIDLTDDVYVSRILSLLFSEYEIGSVVTTARQSGIVRLDEEGTEALSIQDIIATMREYDQMFYPDKPVSADEPLVISPTELKPVVRKIMKSIGVDPRTACSTHEELVSAILSKFIRKFFELVATKAQPEAVDLFVEMTEPETKRKPLIRGCDWGLFCEAVTRIAENVLGDPGQELKTAIETRLKKGADVAEQTGLDSRLGSRRMANLKQSYDEYIQSLRDAAGGNLEKSQRKMTKALNQVAKEAGDVADLMLKRYGDDLAQAVLESIDTALARHDKDLECFRQMSAELGTPERLLFHMKRSMELHRMALDREGVSSRYLVRTALGFADGVLGDDVYAFLFGQHGNGQTILCPDAMGMAASQYGQQTRQFFNESISRMMLYDTPGVRGNTVMRENAWRRAVEAELDQEEQDRVQGMDNERFMEEQPQALWTPELHKDFETSPEVVERLGWVLVAQDKVMELYQRIQNQFTGLTGDEDEQKRVEDRRLAEIDDRLTVVARKHRNEQRRGSRDDYSPDDIIGISLEDEIDAKPLEIKDEEESENENESSSSSSEDDGVLVFGDAKDKTKEDVGPAPMQVDEEPVQDPAQDAGSDSDDDMPLIARWGRPQQLVESDSEDDNVPLAERWGRRPKPSLPKADSEPRELPKASKRRRLGRKRDTVEDSMLKVPAPPLTVTQVDGKTMATPVLVPKPITNTPLESLKKAGKVTEVVKTLKNFRDYGEKVQAQYLRSITNEALDKAWIGFDHTTVLPTVSTAAKSAVKAYIDKRRGLALDTTVTVGLQDLELPEHERMMLVQTCWQWVGTVAAKQRDAMLADSSSDLHPKVPQDLKYLMDHPLMFNDRTGQQMRLAVDLRVMQEKVAIARELLRRVIQDSSYAEYREDVEKRQGELAVIDGHAGTPSAMDETEEEVKGEVHDWEHTRSAVAKVMYIVDSVSIFITSTMAYDTALTAIVGHIDKPLRKRIVKGVKTFGQAVAGVYAYLETIVRDATTVAVEFGLNLSSFADHGGLHQVMDLCKLLYVTGGLTNKQQLKVFGDVWDPESTASRFWQTVPHLDSISQETLTNPLNHMILELLRHDTALLMDASVRAALKTVPDFKATGDQKETEVAVCEAYLEAGTGLSAPKTKTGWFYKLHSQGYKPPTILLSTLKQIQHETAEHIVRVRQCLRGFQKWNQHVRKVLETFTETSEGYQAALSQLTTIKCKFDPSAYVLVAAADAAEQRLMTVAGDYYYLNNEEYMAKIETEALKGVPRVKHYRGATEIKEKPSSHYSRHPAPSVIEFGTVASKSSFRRHRKKTESKWTGKDKEAAASLLRRLTHLSDRMALAAILDKNQPEMIPVLQQLSFLGFSSEYMMSGRQLDTTMSAVNRMAWNLRDHIQRDTATTAIENLRTYQIYSSVSALQSVLTRMDQSTTPEEFFDLILHMQRFTKAPGHVFEPASADNLPKMLRDAYLDMKEDDPLCQRAETVMALEERDRIVAHMYRSSLINNIRELVLIQVDCALLWGNTELQLPVDIETLENDPIMDVLVEIVSNVHQCYPDWDGNTKDWNVATLAGFLARRKPVFAGLGTEYLRACYSRPVKLAVYEAKRLAQQDLAVSWGNGPRFQVYDETGDWDTTRRQLMRGSIQRLLGVAGIRADLEDNDGSRALVSALGEETGDTIYDSLDTGLRITMRYSGNSEDPEDKQTSQRFRKTEQVTTAINTAIDTAVARASHRVIKAYYTDSIKGIQSDVTHDTVRTRLQNTYVDELKIQLAQLQSTVAVLEKRRIASRKARMGTSAHFLSVCDPDSFVPAIDPEETRYLCETMYSK